MDEVDAYGVEPRCSGFTMMRSLAETGGAGAAGPRRKKLEK
jgi:hypothetical protein